MVCGDYIYVGTLMINVIVEWPSVGGVGIAADRAM